MVTIASFSAIVQLVQAFGQGCQKTLVFRLRADRDPEIVRKAVGAHGAGENVDESARVLAPGGLLLAYVATVTQLSRTVEVLCGSGRFTEPESWESMVRTWNVDGLSVRPDHRMVAHTGFLITAWRLAAGSRPLSRKRPPARGAYNEGGYWLPEDVKERTSTDRKVRRVLRDSLAKQSLDATPL